MAYRLQHQLTTFGFRPGFAKWICFILYQVITRNRMDTAAWACHGWKAGFSMALHMKGAERSSKVHNSQALLVLIGAIDLRLLQPAHDCITFWQKTYLCSQIISETQGMQSPRKTKSQGTQIFLQSKSRAKKTTWLHFHMEKRATVIMCDVATISLMNLQKLNLMAQGLNAIIKAALPKGS